MRVRGTLRQGSQAKSLRGRASSQRATNSSALAGSEPALPGAGFRRSRDYLMRCGVIECGLISRGTSCCQWQDLLEFAYEVWAPSFLADDVR